ncbi:Ubiquitin-specific protease 12 isoform 1 [Hibiscus syriacus]|uniref:Ubiquitin-specific protease 12 isoform 1 n=1 Tax=Hibiscus syriacus TaxID=106335 RepID=A0A6A3B196_HIBSY|nr:Ubiquitin-specific protease 12 isoform 1 [Hibiscus syriacus]
MFGEYESSNGLYSILDTLIQENGNALGLDSLAMDVKENCGGLIGIVEGLLDDGVDENKEDHIGFVVPGPDERLEVRLDSGSDDGAGSDERLEVRVDSGINRIREDLIAVIVAGSDERLKVRVNSGSEDNVVVEHAKNEGSIEDHCLGINGVDSVKRIQVSGDNISLYVNFSSFLCRLIDGVDEKIEDHIGVVAAGSDERLEVRIDGGIMDNAVVVTFKDQRTREDDRSGINGVDLVKRIRVSGDNISLYVDFTGTLNEVISSGLMIHEELQEPRNEELMLDGQEHKVILFGLESKVGVGGPERLLIIQRSRTMLCAVEKAMDDLENHLKLEMTCPCVLKENKLLYGNSATNEGASMAECKSSPLGVLSSVQFEPQKFLYQIKDLAQVVSKPAEENNFSFEFLPEQSDVRKNEISELKQNEVLAKISDENGGAFLENCSSKWASTSRKRKRKIYFEVTNNSIQFEGLDRSFELRERKKSKYLSYPYVNQENKAVKRSAKRFQKSWHMKFITASDVTDYPEIDYTSSSVLLSKLHLVAIDHLFTTESNFDVMEWFFSRFRISAYHDESIYEMHCNNMANQKEATATNLSLPATALKPTSSCLTGVAGNLTDLNGKGAISFPLAEDLQVSHSEQSNREGLPDPSGIIMPLTRPNMVSFASEFKAGQKKRGRKSKVLSGHPNQEANNASLEVKSVRKRGRRRKNGEASLSMRNIIVNYNRAGASGKYLATSLNLTFTPGSFMPSKETLVATFCTFGPFKESELQIFKDSSSARVIFMRSEDAAKALQSLEESNPFGATLTKYHLQNDTNLTTQRMEGFRLPASLTSPVPHLADAPPIDFIRRNLETMTQMLEKSGDNLSHETKAKLESEVKALLKKVRSCPS